MNKASKAPRSGLQFTPIHPDIVDAATAEILSAYKQFSDKLLKQITALDAGCGRGEYIASLAKKVKSAVGVEPQESAVIDAREAHKRIKNLRFNNNFIEDFKTAEKFDLIISLTVFEHMANQKKSFQSMLDLLKKDGVIYLTAPNKYWLFEQHYGLPFLSWLPLPLANLYLRLARGINSYEDCSYSMGYFGMKRFFNKFNCKYKFILPIDPEGKYFGCNSGNKTSDFIRNFGISLIKFSPLFWCLSKGFIVIIRKP